MVEVLPLAVQIAEFEDRQSSLPPHTGQERPAGAGQAGEGRAGCCLRSCERTTRRGASSGEIQAEGLAVTFRQVLETPWLDRFWPIPDVVFRARSIEFSLHAPNAINRPYWSVLTSWGAYFDRDLRSSEFLPLFPPEDSGAPGAAEMNQPLRPPNRREASHGCSPQDPELCFPAQNAYTPPAFACLRDMALTSCATPSYALVAGDPPIPR